MKTAIILALAALAAIQLGWRDLSFVLAIYAIGFFVGSWLAEREKHEQQTD